MLPCPGFMVLVTWVKFLREKLKVTIFLVDFDWESHPGTYNCKFDTLIKCVTHKSDVFWWQVRCVTSWHVTKGFEAISNCHVCAEDPCGSFIWLHTKAIFVKYITHKLCFENEFLSPVLHEQKTKCIRIRIPQWWEGIEHGYMTTMTEESGRGGGHDKYGRRNPFWRSN